MFEMLYKNEKEEDWQLESYLPPPQVAEHSDCTVTQE